MTVVPPASGEPRRPDGPRAPGDAWVVAPTGERYWGRFGAAGLLALDVERGVLLQHRVSWSHHGGTWALPGGARHEGESARDGALRESAEEAGVPVGAGESLWRGSAVRLRAESAVDLGYWSYVTVIADVTRGFEPVISDAESVELAWVPVDEVESLPLHPGFAASWPALRSVLPVRPVVVVDAANVVGSVPDGWWRDRAGAAERLIERVEVLADEGVEAASLALPGSRWYPEWVVVVEGQARGAGSGASGDLGVVRVVAAAGSGDDEIAAQAAQLAAAGRRVTVITSDRELGERAWAAGAPGAIAGGPGSVEVRGARWLTELAGH